MKKITIQGLFLIAGILLLVLVGCKNQADPVKEPVKDPLQGVVYTDTVSLESARENIRNYVQYCDSLFEDTVPIRSYTINKSDMLGMFGVTSVPDCEFDHCRVYIGLTDDLKFKLYMTPTVLRPVAKGSKESVYRDTILYDAAHKQYFVYDLNAPCPSTCDKQSKLYN